MAYAAAGLMKIADLPYGRNLWAYFTTDAVATVDTAAYFTGDAIKLMRIGDIILRVTTDALPAITSVSTAGFHIVSAADGTTVDVNDTTAISVTDTD